VGVLVAGLAATTTKVEDIDGAPWGCLRHVRQQPPLKLKTSMAGPLGGVLAAGPAVATTEAGDVDGGPPGGYWRQAGPAAATTEVGDVDGGAPVGCWRQVQQRSPPKLKMSMVGPLASMAV
jgi:hypothetical protein